MAFDVRWHVSFAPDLTAARTVNFADGEILLRRRALRLVLIDQRGVTVDARYLREGECIDIGQIVSFPCHFARIHDRIPANDSAVHGNAARSGGDGAYTPGRHDAGRSS